MPFYDQFDNQAIAQREGRRFISSIKNTKTISVQSIIKTKFLKWDKNRTQLSKTNK